LVRKETKEDIGECYNLLSVMKNMPTLDKLAIYNKKELSVLKLAEVDNYIEKRLKYVAQK
jgi:hypothetical protein